MKCEAVIDDVIIEPNKIQPIIVKFKNGKLKKEKTKKMKCSLLKEKKNLKKKTILAISNGSSVFVGTKPDMKEIPTYSMLAFHNKKTGKVRLVQVERWQVQILTQQAQKNEDNKKDTYSKRMSELNKKFGSKKIQKSLEQNEKLQIDANAMKKQLEKTVANIEIKKEELELPKTEDELTVFIPKCNEEATSVNEIYKLDQIIPQDILDLILEKVEAISNSDISKKSDFFKQTISSTQDSQKIAILIYTDLIARWIGAPPRWSNTKIEEMAPLIPKVCHHVMESYSIEGANKRRTRPLIMKMKAVMHILVLALMINNYKLDVDIIIKHLQLKIGIPKLIDLAKLIRATVSKDKKSIELKLPLPKQPTLVKRYRRSK